MTRLVAIVDSPQAVERTIAAGRAAGWRAVTVCSPAFDEKLLQRVGATRSSIGLWSFAGGIAGIISGFALTIGTVRRWPGLIVGGKPLVAMTPFIVIVFELAILGASVAAVAAFAFAARRARRAAVGACGPMTTDDRFAVLLESVSRSPDVDAVLRSAGASEWRVLR